MSENADCPSTDQLHRALVGELPQDRVSAIEQHLLECGACAEQTLHSGDLQTYSQALRESAQRAAEVVPSADAEQLEQLIDRLRSLPHQQVATQLSGNINGSGATDLESNLIRYLQPARSAEELGWLGTYRVLKLLGSGGMGGVFLAEDTQLHGRVALKVMRPDVSGQANADERFLREARAAAAVHHDHIVTIFQVGRDGQVPFLAMEFLEGESLEDRLRHERVMPLADILRIGREIAEGLAAAHARGLVHRDIKPANIWLESRGGHLPKTSHEGIPPRVKLLDFGLARSAEVNFELTSQGMVIGTPAYMAPEQAVGDMVDHRADLFSLGIVLYRLATGVLPFQGKDAISTLVAIRSETPGDPRQLRSDLPPALSELIIHLLQKNPGERLESAAEVATRLAAIRLAATSIPSPRDTPTLAFQRQPSGKSRGFKWIVAAGAMFSLFLMGAIVVVTTDGGRVEVNTKVDDVNFEVFLTPENGTEIKAFDTKTGSQVTWFWSGKYKVAIKGDTNRVQLDKTTLTLKRGVTEILTLTRKLKADSSSTAGLKQQITNSNLKISPAVSIPEPPPLHEWLKGRQVLTVAQDGSGQFKTIQAAVDALQPGQTVKVLDKGPYREWLHVPAMPPDTGLVTEVQTILEGPVWKLAGQENDLATGGKIDVYGGHMINGANGFRLHGFEMRFPPSNGKRVSRCGGSRTKGFVLENCFFHASEAYEGEVLGFSDWHDGDGVGMSLWIRDCVIEGSVAVVPSHRAVPLDPDRQSTAVIERNYFPGVGTRQHLMIIGESMRNVVIRHNVFAGKSGIDINLSLFESESLEVSNNLLLSPTGITFQERAPRGTVIIRNNLHTLDSIVNFSAGLKLRETARVWNMDHNAYPDLRERASSNQILPRPPGDLATMPRFLSKVPRERDYLRIPADDPLATAGAGGDLPKYIGALSPGPTPKEGDWFSRLRERWQIENAERPETSSPAEIPEPPPLAEWLKGRKRRTVAQDGSGEFKTIQAALNALKKGEVVDVLDKGPYRESLRLTDPPADIGLVSEQQTVVEIADWMTHNTEFTKFESRHGHRIFGARGFRLSGFEMLGANVSETTLHVGLFFEAANDVTVEDCGFRFLAADQSPNPAVIGVDFNGFGPDPTRPIVVRQCAIGARLSVNGWRNMVAPPVLILRNFVQPGLNREAIHVQGQVRQVFVRNNVLKTEASNPGIVILNGAQPEYTAPETIDITNNTVLGAGANVFYAGAPASGVTIRENVLSSAFRRVLAADEKPDNTTDDWQIADNLYLIRPESEPKQENLIFRRPNDPRLTPRFLSENPNDPNFARIAVMPDGRTAGALPPGPAPKDRDWFTRLQERWLIENVKRTERSSPAEIPEPPPLAEWLKGRKVLTVAQDGSGQFKTIQAALDALQPGEVVKVLDKGPYRERLDSSTLPNDSGLVSEVQTILDAPEWKPPHEEPDPTVKVDVYGHMLSLSNGFRWHGFEMRFPPSNGRRTRRLGVNRAKSFVLENCFIHASESPEGEPIAISDWLDGDGVGMSVCLRDCVIEGSVALSAMHKRLPLDPDRLSTVFVERNYFLGVGTDKHLLIAGHSIAKVLIRHNVFAGKSGADINLYQFDTSKFLEVSNNLLLSRTGIAFQECVPRGAVTIRNNVHTLDAIVVFTVGAKLPQAAQSWNMDHNAYPDLRAGASLENVLPRPPGDIAVLPRFLSKVPQEAGYLRIPADDPLATAGAGGQWPGYLGALPPGPAPQDGDWFSRLRDNWTKEMARK